MGSSIYRGVVSDGTDNQGIRISGNVRMHVRDQDDLLAITDDALFEENWIGLFHKTM